jgi:hypothetical protein
MKRRNTRVEVVDLVPTTSAREFVRIWQTASSVAEVAKRVGRSKNACRVRAFRYREYYDVPLKFYPAVVVEEIDWGELAEYAESFERGTDKPSEVVGADTSSENSAPTAG